ncbi:hypothetical protein C8Q76DRAFT_692011 [Earliella scabrosa]|nr:hypothetical protein C8Q76DRAFT_692011 [Earliella scabrosa]
MDELRSEYEAWESRRVASRRETRSWADEDEEELFIEEMILRDLKETEEEEETAPAAVEKPANIIEALRAGIMNAVSVLEENALSTCDDINNGAPATPSIIGGDLLKRMVSQEERDALEVKQFLAAVEEANGSKENVDISGEVAGAERKALKELKVKKPKRSSGKRTRVSAESEGEATDNSHRTHSQQPKKVSKRKDSGPRHQRQRHTLSSIGNAEKPLAPIRCLEDMTRQDAREDAGRSLPEAGCEGESASCVRGGDECYALSDGGVRNADTSADAVGIESAGESLQLAYELHAQPRGLLIIRPTAPEQGTSGTIWYHFIRVKESTNPGDDGGNDACNTPGRWSTYRRISSRTDDEGKGENENESCEDEGSEDESCEDERGENESCEDERGENESGEKFSPPPPRAGPIAIHPMRTDISLPRARG